MATESKQQEGQQEGYQYVASPAVPNLFGKSTGIVLQLPDGAFSASDSHNDLHGPQNCRVGGAKKPGNSHAWCAKIGAEQAITVDLTSSYLVTGVVTQGRAESPQWVTQYLVETSENGFDWTSHGRYVGNFDQHTICKRRLSKPVM